MKNQVQPLLAAVLLSGAMSLGFAGHALGGDAPNGAAGEPADGWYSHGFVKLGGLIFIDRPPVEERSSFDNYGEVNPGFILDMAHLEFGSNDGLKAVEIYGDDLTQNNRGVSASFSSAGRHYLDLEYDEVPRLYKSRAWTLFDGAGSDTLTVPDGVQSDLQTAQFGLNDPGGATHTTDDIQAIIDANIHPTRLEVDRKTGKAAFRLTPSPEWDINLNYSLEKRDGTKAEGSVIGMKHANIRGNPGLEEGIVELIAPVDYTTHNFGASVEYKADLGDGRNWITNLAYAGSIFENANDSLTYDNPFRLDNSLSPYAIDVGGIAVGEDGSNLGRHSLEPDNQAHRFTLNTAADLGELTRFTGTVSYNMMRQDEKLLDWTINDDLFALSPLDLPAESANAAINTLTINTKLTTRALHPDVTLTGRYRYYMLDNDTPHLFVPERIAFDSEYEDSSYLILAPGYVKQNAGLDAVWRASDKRTFGFLFGWEQYDRDIGREADVTNEYSGKLTADLHPHEWMSVRASALYAERRFNEYDYARVDFGDNTGPQNYPLMRKYSMSDRDRIKLNVSTDIVPFDGLTLTGLAGWRDDEYADNFATCVPGGPPRPYDPCEQGLMYDRSWHAGVELNYMATERTGIFASYVREDFHRKIRNRGYDGNPASGNANVAAVDAQIIEPVDTFLAGLNVALVPDRVVLNLGYTYSRGVEEWRDQSLVGFPPDAFPDVTTNFQRFDAGLKVMLPEDHLEGTRFSKAFAKVEYAYERNRVENWADDVTPYAPSIGSTAIWLAGRNPNYNAQIVKLILGLGW